MRISTYIDICQYIVRIYQRVAFVENNFLFLTKGDKKMEQTVNQAIMECKAGKNREGNLNWIIQKFQPVICKYAGKLYSLEYEDAVQELSEALIMAVVELFIFFSSFIIAGVIATKIMNVTETIPVFYLLTWTVKLFATMVPAISCMWAITILFEKPLLSMGLNLFLIIPGVLVANTPLWLVYPYCYSGYVVSDALHTVTTAGIGSTISLFPFIPCAVIISALALCVSIKCFGRKEMR